jgi:quercetin dioxygenase-like cupin family protein
MHVFHLPEEQEFSPDRHIEKKLAKVADGDFSVACWEPGQCSTYHTHPHATEAYFCFQGGGTMHTPQGSVELRPGTFVIHPPGEMHEYENGNESTLLFRVRYGPDMLVRQLRWRGQPSWEPSAEDVAYFRDNPIGGL